MNAEIEREIVSFCSIVRITRLFSTHGSGRMVWNYPPLYATNLELPDRGLSVFPNIAIVWAAGLYSY